MTATELQNIVRALANQTFCRYWLNYHDSKNPVIMAIQCRNDEGKPLQIKDLLEKGFKDEGKFFYTIHRTNENGTPYVSSIF